ncbi:cathepsin B, partial [Elysia marginata]
FTLTTQSQSTPSLTFQRTSTQGRSGQTVIPSRKSETSRTVDHAGCNGGYPTAAYRYWIQDGVVSGGIYGSHKGCYPYEVPPCHTHTPNCTHASRTPKCHHQCIPDFSKSYAQDKHY